MWKKGSTAIATSFSRMSSRPAHWKMLETRLWCVSITPLGRPVVPLEYGSTATCSRGAIRTAGGSPLLRSSDAKGRAPSASPKT